MALASPCRSPLLRQFRRVREASLEMCRPLEAEAFRIQPSEEVSPPWWNLGHTSWFFARNVLQPFGGVQEPQDAELDPLLNSYYVSLGQRLARGRRGLLSRPTTAEVYAYRASVDRRVEQLVTSIADEQWPALARVLMIGIQHEQQHQELFYTEIKSILAQNPAHLRSPYLRFPRADAEEMEDGLPRPPRLRIGDGTAGEGHPPGSSATPAYGKGQSQPVASTKTTTARFIEFEAGLRAFGNAGADWCWDNELPRHNYYLHAFALGDRLVTNRQYLAFLEDGGYRRQLLWLDNGWSAAEQHAWQAPLYWERVDGEWSVWTLAGLRSLALDEPVCHVSFYEADAFARWHAETFSDRRNCRLPTEREWEHAACFAERDAAAMAADEAFLDAGRLHPSAAAGAAPLRQMFGELWQWTASYYEPYPGYRPFPGSLAEYNGKFMDNQRVLRGGSCVTPRDHFRVTYRNFWPPSTRFQFSGIRLAHDLEE